MYNVTDYARDHPGGAEPLLEVGGADATSAYEDVGHSEDAREIMHSYLVGVLEGASTEEPTSSSSAPVPSVKIVRKSAPQASDAQANPYINLRTELAAFAVGTAGLAYLVNSYHLLPALSSTASQVLPHLGGHSAFAQGFATASTALGVAGIVSARYLSNATSFGKAFNSYSPHLHSANPEGATFHPRGVLHPSQYQKFKLRRKEELSDGIYRFVFDLPTKYSILGLPIGQHVAIKGEIDGHTVVRSYTPVSNNRDLGRLELLIRVYPKGQMGNYLKNLEIGDVAEIRGPKGAMKYRRGMSKHIGMIGGGTGITPLFQLIRSICEDKNDDTKISLIYGNRSESDIMLRDKLDQYAKVAGDKFKLHYVLDQPPPDWKGGKGHVTKELLEERMPKPADDTKVLLCGPPGMVNAMKKNLVELGFDSPSAVGKMTDQVFCF